MSPPINLPALIFNYPALPDPDVRRALQRLPNPRHWKGEPWKPWGRAGYGCSLKVVPVGRNGVLIQGDHRMYDSLRDAFAAERLSSSRQDCGCFRNVAARSAALVDGDAQLELMRETLAWVLLSASSIDLDALTASLFAGQRTWREHYLWWLEREDLIGHVGPENQSTLTLTVEGVSVLTMLELTRPGSNIDMSPRALLEQDGTGRTSTISQRGIESPSFLRGAESLPTPGAPPSHIG